MLNLRSIDLNLIPVFEAAYEERSLSRAAERLAMTQSAVSHALTRLRVLFKDQLFVRQARGVLPTPVADRIYAKLHRSLALTREAVTDRRGFDPKTSDRHFAITIPHPLGPMIALQLLYRLAEIAPGITVKASTRSRPIDLERALREGRADVAVDWLPIAGAQLLIRLPLLLPTIAIPRTSRTRLRMSCAPACWRLAAAIPMATTSTGCASIRPSSWPADGCLTAAVTSARSRPFRAGRMRRRYARSSA
jgi:DNA-binding transcriptional LysR family regulator